VKSPSWFAVIVATFLAAGCMPTGGIRITPVPEDRTLRERVVARDPGLFLPKVAIIDIDGIITNNETGGLFSDGEHPVSLLVEKLRAAERDKAVKAVVLRINSPGGGVTASDLMYHEVNRFRTRTRKPVIAMLMDVAASGGYYLACAADEIVMTPTGVTGSIGVIMQTVDLSGTLHKLGIGMEPIKSGVHKDSGSPFRPMREEERQLFQDIINHLYERFVQVVKDGRPNVDPAKLQTIADGRVLTAEDALENGLIDRIGTVDDAIAAVKARAAIKKARVVVYHRPLGWRPTVYAQAGPYQMPTTVNLINVSVPGLFTNDTPFMYLWRIDQ